MLTPRAQRRERRAFMRYKTLDARHFIRIFQLTLVLRQQRTARVEIIGIGLVIKGQRVELAAEGLGIAQFATLHA